MSDAPPPCPPCPSLPDTNGFGRRVLLFSGLLIIFSALAIAAFVTNVTKWIPIVFALLGGSLIPNAQIADILNAWVAKRGSNVI